MAKPKESRSCDLFRFVLSVEDKSLSESDVKRLVQQATQEAIDAGGQQVAELKPSTEVEGGFGGFGEAAVILALVHAAKAGAIAAGLGASKAAGETFFKEFLAPKLRKLNLLPSKFQPLPRTETGQTPKKSGTKQQGKSKRRRL